MAIEKKDTEKDVVAIIAEQLSIEPSTITLQATLQDLGADSLDVVEIIMKIEEKFSVEIDDDKAEDLHSVEQVVNYVHSLRS